MSVVGSLEVKKSIIGEVHLLREIPGYSAYELAVMNGFKGTLTEWLESLKGPKGEVGTLEAHAEIDAKGYRIMNTGEPVESGDAVNKSYFEQNNAKLFRRRLTSADNMNSITEPGNYYYTTDSPPANAPFPNAAIIEVICDEWSGGRVMQRGTRYGAAGYTAFRTLHEGNWFDWRKPAVIWQKEVTGTTNQNGNVSLDLSENYIVLGLKGHNYELAIPYFYPSIGWRANLMSVSDFSRLANVSTTLTVFYAPV